MLTSGFAGRTPALVSLLERLAGTWDIALAPDKARELLEEAGAELGSGAGSADVLVRVGPALGLSIQVITRTPREVVSDAALLVPLAVETAAGFAIVTGRRGTRALVLEDAAEREPVRMTAPALAHLIGAAGPDASAVWLVSEPTLPMARLGTSMVASSGDSGGLGDHTAHDAGHHHATPWQRLAALARLDQRELWLVAAYALFVGVMTLVTPLAVQALVSSVAFGTLVQPVVVLSLIVVVALLFAGLLRALQFYVVEVLQRRLFLRLVSDLAFRLPRVRHSALSDVDPTKLVNRFFDVLTVQKSSATLLLDGIVLVLELGIGLLLIAVYSPFLFVFAFLLLVGLVVIVGPLGRGGVTSAVAESWAKHHTAEWLEDLVRHPVAFSGGTAREAARVRADALALAYLTARRRHFGVLLRQSVGTFTLQAVASAALLGVGGALVMRGQLTLGQLVAAELIVSAIVASLAKISKQLESGYDLLAALDKIGHLVDLPLERQTGEDPREDVGGPWTVDVAELRVAPAGLPVLDGVRLNVARGERVAVLGRAGAGKSTLLRAIVGLVEADAGRIGLNGEDLRDLHLATLRDAAVFVPEHPELFEGTIAENLRNGVTGVRAADVRAVLKEVGLADDVARLPQGLQTRLVGSGAPLSHTQALRLILARALLRRPPLLLVDAALDGLAPEHRERLIDVLLAPDAPWTAVVATRDEGVARRFSRAVRLENGHIVDAHADRGAP